MTKKTALSLRIDDTTHRDLRVLAAERLVSLNDILEEAIESWWAQQPEKTKYAKRREIENPEAATPVATQGEQSTPKKEEGSAPLAQAPKKGAAKKS